MVKNTLRMAWQGLWRAKVWLFSAVMIVIALGFGMALAAEKANFAGSLVLTEFLNTALASAFQFLPWLAFMLTMTALSQTVARDLGAGAFEFYFSRPVRSIDYVLGKLGGATLLVGVQLFAAPMLLAIFRVGIDWDNIGTTWKMIPQSALIGVCATLFFATVPLALSSLVVKPRNGLILFALLWVLVGTIAGAAATATGVEALYVFDPWGLILGVTYGFYGMKALAFRPIPGLWFSVACLLSYSAVAVTVLYWRVRSIERAGIGGR